MLRPYITGICLVLVFLQIGCSSSSKITKVDTRNMADYNPEENPCRFYDEESKIRYDFRTDKDTLYVILQTDNNTAKHRLLGAGLKVYVNNKKSEENYYQFPVHQPSVADTATASLGRPATKEYEKSFINYSTALHVVKNEVDKFDPSQNKYGVSFTIDDHSYGLLTYMFKMPFHKATDKNLVIGLNAPDIQREKNERPYAGGMHGTGVRNGGMRGGMGGMRGGGMRGAGMQREGNPINPNNLSHQGASGKINWWFKINA